MRGMTEKVLHQTERGLPPAERVVAWEERHVNAIRRARTTFEDIAEIEVADLATLSVALRAIRTLATTTD